jgi:hypothetical protein
MGLVKSVKSHRHRSEVRWVPDFPANVNPTMRRAVNGEVCIPPKYREERGVGTYSIFLHLWRCLRLANRRESGMVPVRSPKIRRALGHVRSVL